VAVMRVTSCDFSIVHKRCILSVDVFYPSEEDREGRTYLVLADPKDIATLDDMQLYIEQDIISQREAVPNWSGVVWNSTRV
jgi:hypothetical protein